MSDAVAFVIFKRYSWGYGSCRKYYSNARSWTEVPSRAWFTLDRAEADRWAKELGCTVEARELTRATAKFGEVPTAAIGKRVKVSP